MYQILLDTQSLFPCNVVLWHGDTEHTYPSVELFQLADECHKIDDALLRQVQFIPPRNGRYQEAERV